MNIYLIIEGEYSDWSIKGYFNNKEDAEKYCVSHQGKYDAMYVEDVELLNLTKDETSIKVLKEYDVMFRKYSNKWSMEKDYYNIYEIYTGEKKKTESFGGSSYFTVKVTADNRQKAEKIAQDIFYKWLAKQNNV